MFFKTAEKICAKSERCHYLKEDDVLNLPENKLCYVIGTYPESTEFDLLSKFLQLDWPADVEIFVFDLSICLNEDDVSKKIPKLPSLPLNTPVFVKYNVSGEIEDFLSSADAKQRLGELINDQSASA